MSSNNGSQEVPPQSGDNTQNQNTPPFDATPIIERENSRRQLFASTIRKSLRIVIGLYVFFVLWIGYCYSPCYKPTGTQTAIDWHIGLMIILPATTILLSIIHALKYKDPNDKKEDNLSIPQIKELIDILKPIKELFNLKSNNDK